jgi:adenylate kinase family enzyme
MKLMQVMKTDEWIIDGNYLDSLEMRIKQSDTIFFLDYPLDICLSGIESRVGKEREDMPWVELQLDLEFKQYVISFHENQIPKIYKILKQYLKNRTIIIFKSRKEANQYLENLASRKQKNEEL